MKIHHVVQGSPEWLALRASHNCASDAPVMMGTSDKLTRSDLVRMKATGDEREFSAWVQENLLARGHEVEAFARAEIERELGEELYPATISDDDGYLLASLDGVNMAGDTALEVKLWNEKLVAAMRVGEVPPLHFWQLEQQILVAKLERVIFVCTDGTRDRFLKVEYRAVDGRVTQLLAGWRQFDEDVANYQHVEVIPKAVAEPTVGLPTLVIDVKGDVALASNLIIFGGQLQAFIDRIDLKPADDQGFANAEAAVKTLQTAQERLEAAESAALARFTSIDEMRGQIAQYRDLCRSTRLMLEKVVKARKEEIRGEILHEGQRAFAAHVEKLNATIVPLRLPLPAPDFAAAMRAKKSITTLRDAVSTALANGKIQANAMADETRSRLAWFKDYAKGYESLFPDLQQIIFLN